MRSFCPARYRWPKQAKQQIIYYLFLLSLFEFYISNTYLLISMECTLYLLSSLYLPGLDRGSIGTLFLYLLVETRTRKEERNVNKERRHKKDSVLSKIRRQLQDSVVGVTFRSWCIVDLPDDPGVRPAGDSAVQSHTLVLPHSVGARFNHKLRGVHQAVFVHTLEMFLVFMDLRKAERLSQEKRIHVLQQRHIVSSGQEQKVGTEFVFYHHWGHGLETS